MSKRSMRVLSYRELTGIEFPPSQWVVDFLIPSGGITIVSALPGSYKTWLLLHLAICVATGQSVFGEFATAKSKVLMIDEENGARLIQERLQSLGEYDDLPVSFMFDNGFLAKPQTVEELIEYCKGEDIVFVTIDSLIRIHGANENDAMEMSKVFGQLKRLTSAGISVLLTHHNRKPGGNSFGGSQEMRGSSDILAALDCHLAIKRDDRKLSIKQTKVRLCEELKPIQVELVKGDDGFMDFVYSGAIKESGISRADLLSKHVLGILDEAPANQSEIARRLREDGFNTSINTLRKVLEEQERSDEIRIEPGERNSILYTRNQEAVSPSHKL